jgi:hypothetical protein
MEELLELRACLEQQRYTDALILLGEMEAMSKDDKINKVGSYLIILLIHLIKQQAEQRTTRSWQASIANSVREIRRVNKRRQVGGYYLTAAELRETVAEVYSEALTKAALEAFGGVYDDEQLAQRVDRAQIEQQALEMIWSDNGE